MDTNERLAARLRGLRGGLGLSLEALAERSGVSRSMISLIERGESSPTAAVLDRLAAGLGVTITSLFSDEARVDAPPVARRADQRSWRDPATGYLRRNLSPDGYPSPLEMVEVELPAGVRVAYDSGLRAVAISQQVYMLEGMLELTLGEVTQLLEPGDCLAMRVEGPNAFHNPGDRPARYLIVQTADPSGSRGSTL
jgi:transcriptional regulator with XRE-family HTH domain